MSFEYIAACGSFIGNGRTHNEDNFYFNKKRLSVSNKGLKNPIKCQGTTEEPTIFAVFDGMGGELKGEEASFTACTVFSEEIKKLEELAVPGKEFMLDVCDKANEAVFNLSEGNSNARIGTTVSAVYFWQDEVISCNVGDSKAFRIREDKMIQISEDHTDEKISSFVGGRGKKVLLQYIGMDKKELMLDPYISKGETLSGDIYVICSDGVTNVMSASELYSISCSNTPNEAVTEILSNVDKLNGEDNATVIIVRIL